MTPTDLRAMSRERLLRLVDHMTWYHVIDLGEGGVTKGEVDVRPVLEQYGFPEDLRGKRVLDVGRASGFFSFELERRGADVTATDLPQIFDKDHVGGEVVRDILRQRVWAGDAPPGDEIYGDRLDFALAHLLLNSRVKPVSLRLQDLGPDTVEGAPFDLVFVGSLLNHVSDPVGALRRILSVTGDLCILVNPIDPDNTSSTPSMQLLGRTVRRLTSWWLPNVACLEEMLYCAGFDDVTVVCEALDLPLPGSTPLRHAVLHARRQHDEAAARARWSDWLDHGLARPAGPPIRSPREVELETRIAERRNGLMAAIQRLEADNATKLTVIEQLRADLAEQRRQRLATVEQAEHVQADNVAKLAVIKRLEAALADQRSELLETFERVEADNAAKLAIIKRLETALADQRSELLETIERIEADSMARLEQLRSLSGEVEHLRAELKSAPLHPH